MENTSSSSWKTTTDKSDFINSKFFLLMSKQAKYEMVKILWKSAVICEARAWIKTTIRHQKKE